MIVEFHHFSGEKISFDVDKPTVIIGRSTRCDIVLPFEGFSRQHCQLDVEPGKIYITDLGSVNGVFIDGIRINPHEKTEYNSFFPLLIGPTEVSITISISETASRKVVSKEEVPDLPEEHLQHRVGKTAEIKPFKKLSQLTKKVDWKLLATFILVVGGFLLFQGIKNRFTESEYTEDAYYRMQFNSKLNSNEKDGSVKTKDI